MHIDTDLVCVILYLQPHQIVLAGVITFVLPHKALCQNKYLVSLSRPCVLKHFTELEGHILVTIMAVSQFINTKESMSENSCLLARTYPSA